MAGKYVATSGFAAVKLFDKDPPNLIPSTVVKAIELDADIDAALIKLQLNGYSQNAHRFYRKGRDTYVYGLPRGTAAVSDVNPQEAKKVALAEAKIEMRREASRQLSIANRLKLKVTITPPTDPNYPTYVANEAAAQSKAAATLQLSKTLTVTVVSTELGLYYSNNAWAWYQAYKTVGLFFPTGIKNAHGDIRAGVYDLTGANFFHNTPGHFPKKRINKVYSLFFNFGEVTVTYEDTASSGISTYPTAAFTQPTSNSFDNYFDNEKIIIVYKIDQISVKDSDTFVFLHDAVASNKYPRLTASYSSTNVSNYYPIIVVKENGKDLLPDNFKEGTDDYKKAKTAQSVLKEIEVDSVELMEQINTSADVDDMDDIHVGMFTNITSEEPAVIIYNMLLFEDLRNRRQDGLTDAQHQAYLNKHAAEDVKYKREFPFKFRFYFELSEIERARYPAITQRKIQININNSVSTHALVSYFTFSTIYIYIEENIAGTIGPIGATSILIEKGEYPGTSDYWYGSGTGYIEYKYQTSESAYKMLRLHRPGVGYVNWWYGEGKNGNYDTYMARYDLRYSSANTALDSILADTWDELMIPCNYNLAKTLSGRKETDLYYASLGILIFTVKVEFIPGWKTFLKALIIIIVVVVAVLTGQIGLIALVVVSLLVSVLVEQILLQQLDAAAAAKGIVGLSIALGILSLGANILGSIGQLLTQIPKITLLLLGAITNIIGSSLQLKTLNLQQEYLEFLDDSAAEDKKLEDYQAEVMGENYLDPLMVGFIFNPYESPNEFYSKRLNTGGISDLSYLVDDFVETALLLPEYIPEAEEGKNGILAFVNETKRQF